MLTSNSDCFHWKNIPPALQLSVYSINFKAALKCKTKEDKEKCSLWKKQRPRQQAGAIFFNHTLQVGALGEYGEKMSCILKSIKEWKKKLASGEKLLCFYNVNILWG